MVQLVTVRTLTEATQHMRLVTGEGGAGLHTLAPPGEGAATAAVWSQHGGVLTTAPHNTYHHCSVSGNTKIFIHGVRFSFNDISTHPMQCSGPFFQYIVSILSLIYNIDPLLCVKMSSVSTAHTGTAPPGLRLDTQLLYTLYTLYSVYSTVQATPSGWLGVTRTGPGTCLLSAVCCLCVHYIILSGLSCVLCVDTSRPQTMVSSHCSEDCCL